MAQTELNDLHAVFVRAVAEGRAPDLAILDSVWIAEFAASGFLWPLEELDPSWVDNELHRDFLEPFVDAHRIGDGTLAVQAEMDVAGMWYERAAVGTAGPRTWAELQETGRRLAADRGAPVLVMPAGPSADEFATYCLVALLASNTARVLGPDSVTLDSPASVEAMRLLQALVDDKVLSTGAVGHERDRPIQMLARGEALMAFGGSTTTIDSESEKVGPGPEMNKLVWDWARLINQQLPFITYATKVYQFPYSAQSFTDWPPVNSQGTSPQWNVLGQGNMTQELTVMLEDGYIRPKS